MNYLFSAISILVISSLALFTTAYGLKLKDKVSGQKLVVFVVVFSAITFLVNSSFSLLRLGLLGTILGIVLVALSAFFLGRNYLKLDQKTARNFSIYLIVSFIVIALIFGFLFSLTALFLTF